MSDYVGTLESIPNRSTQLISGLSISAENVTIVADAVKKSYTDLPTSERAVGLVESKVLTEVRDQMTEKLVLYRDFHLPLSITMVNDLVRTLDYFEMDFEEFKTILGFVRKQVSEAEERANFVHAIFSKLSVDLLKLGEDAQKALKSAEIAAQENLKSAVWRGKLATSVGIGGQSVAAGVLTSALVVGSVIAPEVAVPACIVGSAVWFVTSSTSTAAAIALKSQSNQKQIIADVLKESGEIYENVLVGALKKFAECMTGFSGFFKDINLRLENVKSNMSDLGDVESSDKELRTLYDVIRRQSADLRQACSLYVTHTSSTNVAIGVLDRLENENYRGYIDEWYSTCSLQLKCVPSIKSLLKKAVPHMKALYR